MTTWQQEAFQRLADQVAAAVYRGTVEEKPIPPGTDGAIGEFCGTRVQVLRQYDIQRDDWMYRIHVLKAKP